MIYRDREFRKIVSDCTISIIQQAFEVPAATARLIKFGLIEIPESKIESLKNRLIWWIERMSKP